MKRYPELFLICTGLGRIQRGFETHINDLATKLINENLSFKFQVCLGKRIKESKYKQLPILHVPRNSKLLSYCSNNTAFVIEQISFFAGIIPYIIFRRPKAIYLGEYNLFCYLYKLRNLFNLNYSLVLYTGGQAIPGLFNKSRDFVHHITDVYYDLLINQGIPQNRQFIIPHFVEFPYKPLDSKIQIIHKEAQGKKILLSVGQIDMAIKRMHLIAELFGQFSNFIFPILIGAETEETKKIRYYMDSFFGENGYKLTKVNREELASYYTAADFFILCSEKESFGMVFLEALLFNLPIICHDFPESRYVLKDNALFINMSNLQSSKEVVFEKINSLQKLSNFSGSKYVEYNFSWKALKSDYLFMFTQIMTN